MIIPINVGCPPHFIYASIAFQDFLFVSSIPNTQIHQKSRGRTPAPEQTPASSALPRWAPKTAAGWRQRSVGLPTARWRPKPSPWASTWQGRKFLGHFESKKRSECQRHQIQRLRSFKGLVECACCDVSRSSLEIRSGRQVHHEGVLESGTTPSKAVKRRKAVNGSSGHPDMAQRHVAWRRSWRGEHKGETCKGRHRRWRAEGSHFIFSYIFIFNRRNFLHNHRFLVPSVATGTIDSVQISWHRSRPNQSNKPWYPPCPQTKKLGVRSSESKFVKCPSHMKSLQHVLNCSSPSMQVPGAESLQVGMPFFARQTRWWSTRRGRYQVVQVGQKLLQWKQIPMWVDFLEKAEVEIRRELLYLEAKSMASCDLVHIPQIYNDFSLLPQRVETWVTLPNLWSCGLLLKLPKIGSIHMLLPLRCWGLTIKENKNS